MSMKFFDRGFIRRLNFIILVLAASNLASCSEEEDRQETISKLRALGVEQSPVVAKPGDTVTLTFYMAGPPKLAPAATPVTDAAARYSDPILVTPIDPATQEVEVGPVSLYSFKATYVVPSDDKTLSRLGAKGLLKTRYAVKFVATNGDQETIVGDSLIYPLGSPQLLWTSPTISITKPGTSVSTGKIDLEGSITSTGSESNKVAWFVSSGKLKNRKARTTQWEEASKGSQAIFFTVRGAKSGAFAIKSQVISLD